MTSPADAGPKGAGSAVPAEARVWMYWEQRPGHVRAPYLDLCRQTISDHLGDLTLEVVDERSVFDWLPDLDRATWTRLPDPTRRSDYCRIRLLHSYGGLYVDADCIVLSSLEHLIAPLSSESFVTFGDIDGPVQNNLFASRAGAPILEEWIEGQDRLLFSTPDWSALDRTALGEPLITPIASRWPHHRFPERSIAPVMWYEWGRFFSRCTSPARVLRDGPLTVMLYNEFMCGPLRDTTTTELRRGKILLSRLFRIALGESTPDEEVDLWTRCHLLADVRYSNHGRAFMGRVRRVRERIRPVGPR